MPNWIELYTIGGLLARAAERAPDDCALMFPGEATSFAALDARAVDAARSLAAMDVNKGDHVGILMPNCAAFVDVLLGCALLGAWAVPINARYKARELAYVIENADLRVLVTTDRIDEHVDFVELLEEALPSLKSAQDPSALSLPEAPLLRSIVVIGARAPSSMLPESAFRVIRAGVGDEEIARRRARVAVRDVAIMMYTSGTTAMPKGCPLSHEALVRPALEAGRTRFELTSADRMWDPLPMFHMSFVLPFLACLDAGAALLAMERFEPSVALRYLSEQRATVNFASFPTITQALLSHPDFDASALHFRLMNNVGPADLLRQFQVAFPFARHISAYGLTEAGGVTAFGEPGDDDEVRATTSGRPFSGVEVIVRDPSTNETMSPGERGELNIRGYCLFEGYYKSPEKNAEAFDDEGWFHTGDLGSIDAHGRITYLGRTKDMLKVGGENVAAVEIEGYLQTHPAVLLAQVVSAPDAKYGEVAAAFVQLRSGSSASEEDLIAYCRGKIASFKIPRHVRFVEAWPMSATKIQKFKLREAIEKELIR
jgi:acyl-CoA synthetase (AMP-forming)/AMP-acid ligase II